MKLESINFWFIVRSTSISQSVSQIMDLGTCCLHPPQQIKVPSKFIFCATKSFFRFFSKKSNFFLSKNFGLLGIKSVHGRPDSPSWYSDSWPYIVLLRVELHRQLPSLLVHWSYRERNTHPCNATEVRVCTLTKARKVRSAYNCTYKQNKSLL